MFVYVIFCALFKKIKMDLFHNEARTHIALAASVSSSDEQQQRPVYASTTIPIITNKDNKDNHRRQPSLAVTAAAPTTNQQQQPLNGNHATVTDEIMDNNDNGYKFQHFRSLPSREPLDIQFKNISYTVKMGFNTGK